MAKITDEDKNNFKKNLEYIGLNLERIPKALLDFEELGFSPSNTYNDNDHKVFRYVPINDIYILLTPTNRLNDIKDKYGKAKPISAYINPENIEEYATFLKMLNQMSIEEIEKIEERQQVFNKKIPFGVQYDKDYSWQIYYAEPIKKYFMLVTTEDYEYSHFFYLLKEQLKYFKSRTKKEKLIYVPINHIDYSAKYLKKSEIADTENYLWLFTKDWPNIYEVYDKEGNMELDIIGNTCVYRTVKSGYKVSLKTEEEAKKFYKYLKALFILQTELPFHYSFMPKVEKDCSISLYYNQKKITEASLTEFIKKEYVKAVKTLSQEEKSIGKLEKQLADLKSEAGLKDLEYIKKQKEIAMYLEYKKTFFGKIKLFLKFKKKDEKKNTNINEDEIEENLEISNENETIENGKEYYTIEDLVTIHAKLDKKVGYTKNLKADIKALELKIKNLNSKIENATMYINEIDNHKKSIFEFWKFVNKDELVAIEGADEKAEETSSNNIKKVFEYKTDLADLGIQMDKLQRNLIEKEAQDSIFLANTDVLQYINIMKHLEYVDENELRDYMKSLKKVAENKKNLYKIEDFDIFGSISDSSRRVKTLANQKHREAEKELLKILNVSRNMDLIEFRGRLEKALECIKNSMEKIKTPYDMPIYLAAEKTEEIDKFGYGVYDIIPENALQKIKNSTETEFNLYKINLQENMPLIYMTNIMYYDNFNQTLPLGMNVEEKVLIDADKFEFIPNNMITFNISDNFTENELLNKPAVKKIMLCEYEVKLKNNQKEKKEDEKIDKQSSNNSPR